MKGKVIEKDATPSQCVEVYGQIINLNKVYELNLSLTGREFAQFVEFVNSGGKKTSTVFLDKLIDILTEGY